MAEDNGESYPFNKETPTQWINIHRPDLSYFVFRKSYETKNGIIWLFECSFGGRTRSTIKNSKKTKFKCNASFKVRVYGGRGYFTEENFTHTHSTDEEFLKAWTKPDSTTIEKIHEMTENGETCPTIRKKLELTIPTQVFYDIRRPIIKKSKTLNQDILDELFSGPFGARWLIIKHHIEQTNELESISFISKRFLKTPIALDVVQMDDIQCVTNDNNTIINLCIKDANNVCQIIAFAITNSRKEQDFERFLNDIKEHHGEPRVFVVDRCGQQFDAIKQTTESKIVFCKVHIRRNIQEMFGVNIVVRSFDQLIKRQINDEEFIAILKEESDKRDEVSKKRISNLIDDMIYFSPSKISSLRLRDQYTTNVVEGYHGTLRYMLEGKKRIDDVLKTIDQIHQQLITKSYRKLDNFAPNIYKGPPLGSVATQKLKEEYEKALQAFHSPDELTECSCNLPQEYGLPCWHEIFQIIQNQATIENINEIYHRIDYAKDFTQTVINRYHGRIPEERIQWNYSKLMRKFELIAGLCLRDNKVKQAVLNLFDALQDLRIQAPGASIARPALMIAGRKRSKRCYKCSYCNQNNHNKKTCPMRRRDELSSQTTHNASNDSSLSSDSSDHEIPSANSPNYYTSSAASSDESTSSSDPSDESTSSADPSDDEEYINETLRKPIDGFVDCINVKEEIQMLTKLTFDQLAIYNKYAWLFRPFIMQITEEKDVCDIATWNGIFISQYMKVKKALEGRPGFSEKCDIIILIANLNFHKPNLSEELMNHLYQLTNSIEEDPVSFDVDTNINYDSDKYDEEAPLLKE